VRERKRERKAKLVSVVRIEGGIGTRRMENDGEGARGEKGMGSEKGMRNQTREVWGIDRSE
jgi:hypothetical protein